MILNHLHSIIQYLFKSLTNTETLKLTRLRWPRLLHPPRPPREAAAAPPAASPLTYRSPPWLRSMVLPQCAHLHILAHVIQLRNNSITMHLIAQIPRILSITRRSIL